MKLKTDYTIKSFIGKAIYCETEAERFYFPKESYTIAQSKSEFLNYRILIKSGNYEIVIDKEDGFIAISNKQEKILYLVPIIVFELIE